MTIKALTGVALVAVLASSATAAVQLIDSVASSRASSSTSSSKAEPATTDGALVFVVAPSTERFSTNAAGVRQREPRVVVLGSSR